MTPNELMLPEEISQAEMIARESGNPIQRRVARILLSYQGGKATREIAEDVGLSKARTRYWRRIFTKIRMGVFDHPRVEKGQSSQPQAETLNSDEITQQIDSSLKMGDEPLQPAPDPALHSLLLDQPLPVVDAATGLPYPTGKSSPGLVRTDTMAEAGRKIFCQQFAEMLEHEPGTKLGEDIEELHDMRVSTRRMRAAFDLFGGYYQPKAVQPLLKGLRQTGRILGAVRDMDVFIENAGKYMETLPEADRPGVAPLIQEWQLQRELHRQEMLTYLDSPKYARFKASFNIFVQTQGMGTLLPDPENPIEQLVQNIAPQIIYNRLANVRAYETILGSASLDQLHSLRIETKKLRYALEFFREVLGSEVKAVISTLKGLQDHLGALNDARVACELLGAFLEKWEMQQAVRPLAERVSSQPLVTYLAASYAERHRLMVSVPQAWEKFSRPEFRQNLAMAVSVL